MLWNDAPPEPRSRHANWPTLLVSWWCTALAVVIILTRLIGRKIRTGRLFREDKIMALSLVPLLARMGLVHVILLYGTNNVRAVGLSELQIHQRSIGSRLVLASRIFYALFIWVSKFTVSEFLKRLTSTIWRRSYEVCLQLIRGFLVATFIAVVIATLTECHPFHHYWQVVPDPGPQCREGYAQLLTMGTADIITDILLIIFPIPIVLRSNMPLKRKLSLVGLFSFSLLLIIITGFRMPEVILHHGRQQYRTVWASFEIVASAAVSNAVILGSFVRDRGVKRNKYRRGSAIDSIERAPTRRNTLDSYRRNSDEALFRDIGCRMPQNLFDPTSPISRPAPAALTTSKPYPPLSYQDDAVMSPLNLGTDTPPSPHDSAEALRKQSSIPPSPETSRSFSLFDVGGLLTGSETRNPSHGTISHDFAIQPSSPRPPPPSRPDSSQGLVSENVGTRFLPVASRNRASQQRALGRDDAASLGPPLRPTIERDGSALSLHDVGGLLK